jgi:phosphatidate cytidylyltransferase
MQKRWLTGVILAAVILVIILFGSTEALAAVITIFIFGGVWEYNKIVFGKGFIKEKIEGLIFAVIIPLTVLLGSSQIMIAVLAFCIMTVFILFLWSVKEATFDILTVAKVIFGIMYIPFLLSHFILLRKMPAGELWVLFVLVLAFAGDTAALYIGKYFGKNKLIALVSPGKTVEGTIALVLGSVIACLIFSYFCLPEISLVHIFILAFVGSIIGQLGDLCESAIKRNYGQKDASSLLPGHGGLLDRMDCLIFIVPFVYYYRIFVIG